MAKSNKVGGKFECNPMSIKYSGKALGSSNDTVNPHSIRKSGKKIG